VVPQRLAPTPSATECTGRRDEALARDRDRLSRLLASDHAGAGQADGERVHQPVRLPRKWLILGIAIGIIAGFGALDYAGKMLLGFLGGYHVRTPYGDGGDPGSPRFTRPWAIPLVVFGGALVSALLVAKLAPEAEGHGTDSAIEAVHTDPRAIRVPPCW